jgi:hypothetical protein
MLKDVRARTNTLSTTWAIRMKMMNRGVRTICAVSIVFGSIIANDSGYKDSG